MAKLDPKLTQVFLLDSLQHPSASRTVNINAASILESLLVRIHRRRMYTCVMWQSALEVQGGDMLLRGFKSKVDKSLCRRAPMVNALAL